MILDLEKIAKLERKYSHDSVAFNALSNMVELVSSSREDISELVNSVQYLTLCDLGIIKGMEKKPEQLNS